MVSHIFFDALDCLFGEYSWYSVTTTFTRSLLLLVSISGLLIAVLLALMDHNGFQTFTYTGRSCFRDTDHDAQASFAFPCISHNRLELGAQHL
jgi:hypothetical protein